MRRGPTCSLSCPVVSESRCSACAALRTPYIIFTDVAYDKPGDFFSGLEGRGNCKTRIRFCREPSIFSVTRNKDVSSFCSTGLSSPSPRESERLLVGSSFRSRWLRWDGNDGIFVLESRPPRRDPTSRTPPAGPVGSGEKNKRRSIFRPKPYGV